MDDMRHIFRGSSLLCAHLALSGFGLVAYLTTLAVSDVLRDCMRHFVYPLSTARWPLKAWPQQNRTVTTKAKRGGVDSTHSRNTPQHSGADAGAITDDATDVVDSPNQVPVLATGTCR